VVGTYMMGSQAASDYSAAKTSSAAVEAYNRAYGLYLANQTFYVIFGFAYIYNLADAALNAGAPAQAQLRLPADIQIALAPEGPRLIKEWTW